MGMVRTRVWDVTGSRSQMVEAPDDVAIGRIIVILVDRMNLPLNSPDGQLMSYKLHHKRHRSTVARITDAPRRRRDRQRRSAVAT